MWFFPCFWMVMTLHCSSGFRLCDIMLCSCPRTVASWFTLMGLAINCSKAARRVGLDRLMKKRWQIFVRPFFIFSIFPIVT